MVARTTAVEDRRARRAWLAFAAMCVGLACAFAATVSESSQKVLNAALRDAATGNTGGGGGGGALSSSWTLGSGKRISSVSAARFAGRRRAEEESVMDWSTRGVDVDVDVEDAEEEEA